LRDGFQEVKGVQGIQSNEKLTYKGTLLSVIVNKEVVGVRALTKVLKVDPLNINYVVERMWEVKMSSSLQWVVVT
jgi:hypothetical protein